MVFPVVMYGCKSWTIKKVEHKRIDAFKTVVLEKTLESPLDCKEIQLVNPKGNRFWIFIGRTDAEAEAPIVWPPDTKSPLIGKVLDIGKDWRHEEKGMTGWDGCMASQTPWTWLWANSGRYEGQGSLVCCSPWSHRVRCYCVTELNWTDSSWGIVAWCVYLSCQPALLFLFLILIQWFQWLGQWLSKTGCITITWKAPFPWIFWFHVQNFWFWNEVQKCACF